MFSSYVNFKINGGECTAEERQLSFPSTALFWKGLILQLILILYNVYFSIGETNWLMVATGVADCYYNVMDLPTGATYRFRVACVNKAGQGPYSNLSEKVVLDSTGAQK